MEFPEDILQIIRAYSKPLTRPNWREGAPHAAIFKYSIVSQNVKDCIYDYYTHGFDFMGFICPELYDDTPFSDILNQYGDKIFPYYNFYHIMVRQNMLNKTMYVTYRYRNGQQEWIYINDS